MAIDSSTSGLQSVNQLGWQQLKLQQAKRNADQAEQTAQILQQQAAAARQEASRAQENARALALQSDQAQSLAVRARQGLTALNAGAAAQSQLTYVIDQAVQRRSIAQTLVPSRDQSSSAANAQGQTTGTIINTTA